MRGKFSEKYPPVDPIRLGPKTYICRFNFSVLRVWLPFLCLLMGTSCLDVGDCLVSNSNLVRVSLKSVKTKKDSTVAFTSVKLANGTVLYANKGLSSLELPVDPSATVTAFYFQRDALNDTLIFQYRNEAVVVSPDCGAFPFQKDVNLVHNTFERDSVRWLNNQLSKTAKVNVEVFF